jgi:hypothetical protein
MESPRFTLVDPVTGLYWTQNLPADVFWGKDAAADWIPRFQGNPHFEYSEGRIKLLWNRYEHVRRRRGDSTIPELMLEPHVVIVKAMPRRALVLEPFESFCLTVNRAHGHVLTTAITKVCEHAPLYAIKRRGRTKAVADVLPDTILHEGMYLFCFNEDDLALAKIALGANIAQTYDLRDYR